MIHPVDRAAGLVLSRGPRRLRFFGEGWGREDLLDPRGALDEPPADITITWLSATVDATGNHVSHGTFPSPGAELPARSALVHVQSVEPPDDTRRIVVLMPAWNEHDPRVRVALARRLASRGIRSIILENPYYGTRHPDHEGGQPIRTVSDFMVMGRAAVQEARAILASFHAEGHTVGVSGYSMGGNTAALVSATLDFPVATAPLAASHSPGPVFLDGVLHNGIDWEALGGAEQEPRLRETLGWVSVLNVAPQPHTASAIVVRAASDGYIPVQATRDLVDHWPGSELRTLPGGHATLIWYRKDRLADVIAESFDRLFGSD